MIPDKIYYSYINVKNGEEKCIEIPITADDVYKNTDTIIIGINNRHRSMIHPGSKKFRLNLSSHLNIVFHSFYIYGIYTTEKKSKAEIHNLIALKMDEDIKELTNQFDKLKAKLYEMETIKNRILEANID